MTRITAPGTYPLGFTGGVLFGVQTMEDADLDGCIFSVSYSMDGVTWKNFAEADDIADLAAWEGMTAYAIAPRIAIRVVGAGTPDIYFQSHQLRTPD